MAWGRHSDSSVWGSRCDTVGDKAAVLPEETMPWCALPLAGAHTAAAVSHLQEKPNAKQLWEGSSFYAIWKAQSRQGQLISMQTEVARGTAGPRIHSAHWLASLTHCVGQVQSYYLMQELCTPAQESPSMPMVSRQQTLRMRGTEGSRALVNWNNLPLHVAFFQYRWEKIGFPICEAQCN